MHRLLRLIVRLGYLGACAAFAPACSGSSKAASTSAGAGGRAVGTGGHGAGGANGSGGASGAVGNGGASGCGNSDWAMYGHDVRRTSASDGCISGPLTFAWSYLPTGWLNSTIGTVISAVTHGSSVFVRFTSSFGPQLDGVSSAGAPLWTWAMPLGRDLQLQQWASYGGGKLIVADDGLCLVDAATGANTTINMYDDWGQTGADADRFYINSDLNSPDGTGMYVGAYSFTGGSRWRRDVHRVCDSASEKRGSLAVDGGTYFRAGIYTAGSPVPEGLVSYTASSGSSGWKQTVTPWSALSAGDGRLYLVEGTGSALVARSQTDGTIKWSKPLTGTVSTQSPVLAAGLVIIATSAGIAAYHAADGSSAWSAPNISAVAAPATDASRTFGNCPGKPVAWVTIPYTTLAAALGSNSLVVTADDAVHVLSLTDGKETWKGLPSQVTGPLHNPAVAGHSLYAVDLGAGTTGKLVALTSP